MISMLYGKLNYKRKDEFLIKFRENIDYEIVNKIIEKYSIKDIHEKLSPIVREATAKANYVEYDYSKFDCNTAYFNQTIDEIDFRTPKDSIELTNVAKMFSNCVASYNKMIDDARSLIVYGVQKDVPEVCIELVKIPNKDNEIEYRINQFYAPHNKTVTNRKVYSAFNKILDELKFSKIDYKSTTNIGSFLRGI